MASLPTQLAGADVCWRVQKLYSIQGNAMVTYNAEQDIYLSAIRELCCISMRKKNYIVIVK